MTNAEKLSIGISVVALIVSIVAPFILYQWYQNDVRIQQIKATSLDVYQTATSSAAISFSAENEETETTALASQIHISNKGSLPVDGIELILKHRDDEKFFDSFYVNVYPPVAFKKSLVDGRLSIEFEKPLPPKQKVTIHIESSKTGKDVVGTIDFSSIEAWIRSEALPTTPVKLTPGEP